MKDQTIMGVDEYSGRSLPEIIQVIQLEGRELERWLRDSVTQKMLDHLREIRDKFAAGVLNPMQEENDAVKRAKILVYVIDEMLAFRRTEMTAQKQRESNVNEMARNQAAMNLPLGDGPNIP